ncbi:MAG: ABC transporter permease [Prevotellaceae bacterium]|jgi:hypothetical protein|nr:ABC transporter permease [Prevotellaceae bacterium]
MLSKLLKQNISKTQLFGFAVANLIGMTIVLIAVQLYCDINPLFTQKDTLFKRDFFVITKKINVLNTISSNISSTFSSSEIEELKHKNFIKSVGKFTSSQFEVYGGVSAAGLEFGTDLFFESVPNNFIDIQSDRWQFSQDSTHFIPIIVPKTYLDLYNFGFAQSRQMPKLSEGVIGMVQMNLTFVGMGRREKFTGGIVGFSNRINTILVPEEFMQWANNRFSTNPTPAPARLILEIDNITDPEIATFFKAHSYQIEGENQAVGRMSFFLKIVVGIAILIGLIICVLSFVILILSIYLILQKDMQKLQNLRLIGYSKYSISMFYILLTTIINVVILIVAVAIVIFIRPHYNTVLSDVFGSSVQTSLLLMIGVGIGIFLTVSSINIFIINRKIK